MKRISNAIFLLSILFSFCACDFLKKEEDEEKSPKLIASCLIQDIEFDDLECLEYYSGYSGDSEESCDDAQERNFASLKNHRDQNSASYCPSTARIAQCKLSNHVLYFYEEGYSAGSAQTECNSLNGEFQQ